MKKKILIGIALIASIIVSNSLYAQQGQWIKDRSKVDESEELTLTKDTSEWIILTNQLEFTFATEYKKDTAFLKVINSSYGQLFPNLRAVKIGEIFAKCYLTGKEKLHIVYLDKTFVKDYYNIIHSFQPPHSNNPIYKLPNDLYAAPNDNADPIVNANVTTSTKSNNIDEMLRARQRLNNQHVDNMNGSIPTLAQAMNPGTTTIANSTAIGQEENHQGIKSDLYILYLKSLDSIRDKDAWNYYDAFDPLPSTLNEFQERKYLSAAITKLDSIRNGTSISTTDRKYITTAHLGEYNFDKNGFSIKEMNREEDIPFLQDPILHTKTSYPIKTIFEMWFEVHFANINSNTIVPLDAAKAEELTNKYFQKDRTVYCIYTFDYIANRCSLKPVTSTTIYFTQYATVKSIDFYTDKECTQKFATVPLN